MPFNKKLHALQNRLFDTFLLITYILYAVIALGLSANAPEYLSMLEYFIKIYISLFLIYRFNPFRQVTFTDLDVKIAFNAGWFLLTTTIVGSILQTYLDQIKQYLTAFNFTS
jgi:hypothetical protein